MVIINAQAYTAFGHVIVVASAVDHEGDRRNITLLGSTDVGSPAPGTTLDDLAVLAAMIRGLTELRESYRKRRESWPL